MWPIGHVAGAYILFSLYARWSHHDRPDEIAVSILLVGSVFPDLVDKPLAWYVGALPTGRTLGHSLLFVVPLLIVVLALAYRYDRLPWGIAFGIGVLSHLLLDALPVFWEDDASAGFLLYPIIPQEPYEEGPPSVIGMLLDSLTDLYFISEFAILGIALVMWRADRYPGLALARSVVSRIGNTP